MSNKECIINIPEPKIRANIYLTTLRKRKVLEKKSLVALINTFDLKAREESKKYSRF